MSRILSFAQKYRPRNRFLHSFGVGEWSPGESQETLIDRIDQALYEAKHAGRDRVILSPTPTRQAFHF